MKHLLIALYFTVLAIPLVAWVRQADFGGDWRYEVVRLAGLLGFTLIFLQLAIGAFMSKLRPIFGHKLILRWHIAQGIVGFIFANVHPLALVALFGIQKVLNLTGYAAWGRFALILLWVSVLAGLMRTTIWLQKYWRWVHRLNYLIFGLVYWHSWNLGSDTQTMPMAIIYWISPVVFVMALLVKLQPIWQTLVKRDSVS